MQFNWGLMTMFTLSLLVGLSSCSKETSPDDNLSATSGTFSIVKYETEEAYALYLEQANILFSGTRASSTPANAETVNIDAQSQTFRPSESQLNELYVKAQNTDFEKSYVDNQIKRYDSFVSSFPEMKNNVTAYSHFIQLLKERNHKKWIEATKKYPNLYWVGNHGLLSLVHTDLLSSMINMEGMYLVADKLICYKPESIDVYENGSFNIENGHVHFESKPDLTHMNTKAYTVRYNDYQYFSSVPTIRLLIIGKDDVVFGIGFPPYQLYGQIESYSEVVASSLWTPFAASEIHTSVRCSCDILNRIENVAYNSAWGSAGGHIMNIGSASTPIYGWSAVKVLPGWGYLNTPEIPW